MCGPLRGVVLWSEAARAASDFACAPRQAVRLRQRRTPLQVSLDGEDAAGVRL